MDRSEYIRQNIEQFHNNTVASRYKQPGVTDQSAKLSNAGFNKLMDSIYYRALNRIKGYIRDDSLSDPECFQQIELVISTLEHLGSSGGFRHDF